MVLPQHSRRIQGPIQKRSKHYLLPLWSALNPGNRRLGTRFDDLSADIMHPRARKR